MTFSNIAKPLDEALVKRGYTEMTPVQAAVIAPDALGRDLVVSAQTGSGKTVAFGLAMADVLLDENGRSPPAATPLALIIAPTRELALQVSREFIWLYGPSGARIATCVGGMDASKERRTLSQGAQIVVGTPGRLRDHLERGALNLMALRCAVLDEADEMLDMGFREDLEAILDASPPERRTLLFSATMPKPIVALAKRYQQDALRISTVSETRGHGDIAYQCVAVAPSDIEHVVVNILRLHEAETAMLFCATRENVRHLHAGLIERGFAAVALSGEHSQNERNAAMAMLRDQRARVCVATDVAARGIDLPSLSLVVHVEIPRDMETLQHRSGRTGRAGKKGTALLVVPFSRRKRVEGMLRGAQINAEWINAPTAKDIARNDHARLLEQLLAPADHDEEDMALAAELLKQRSPEDIAAALVHVYRARLPHAEEIQEDGPRPRRMRDEGQDERPERSYQRPSRGTARPERGARPERAPREDRDRGPRVDRHERMPRVHANANSSTESQAEGGRAQSSRRESGPNSTPAQKERGFKSDGDTAPRAKLAPRPAGEGKPKRIYKDRPNSAPARSGTRAGARSGPGARPAQGGKPPFKGGKPKAR